MSAINCFSARRWMRAMTVAAAAGALPCGTNAAALFPALPVLGAAGSVDPSVSAPLSSQPEYQPQSQSRSQSSHADYATFADMVERAPLVIDVTVTDVRPLRRQGAPERVYVRGKVNALIRGTAVIAGDIAWLAAPLAPGAAKPLARKARLLLFAGPVAGKPAEVQLIAADAYRDHSDEGDRLTRGIVTEFMAPDAPPAITGIASAFYVPGAIAGEGETQIFLQTGNGNPASLFVRRSPDGPPRWGVAFGEVVTSSETAPRPDTLGWYRLACGLPATLPDAAFMDGHIDRREDIMRDYALIRSALGPCHR